MRNRDYDLLHLVSEAMQQGSRVSRRLICGDEQDACTPWKRVLQWHSGERRQTKRKINKRERREGRAEGQSGLQDANES